MKKYTFIVTVLIFTILSACTNQKNLSKSEKEMKDIKDYLKENHLKVEPTQTGLYYIETVAGTGRQAQKGDVVSVHYSGRLLNGKKFDSSYDRNEPFEFTLGAGQVIKGWDEGIAYLKEGGKATLIIPSKLAYGEREIQGVIPANSPLIFDVELLKIK